jgi:hypothetical protein
MCRIIIPCILWVTLFAWPCEAKLVFGIKGGVNSPINWKKSTGIHSKFEGNPSLIAGLTMITPVDATRSSFFRLELLYAYKSWQGMSDGQAVDAISGINNQGPEPHHRNRASSTLDDNHDYWDKNSIEELVLAPSLVFTVDEQKAASVFVQFGPELAYDMRVEQQSEWNNWYGQGSRYNLDYCNSTNIGFNIGLGLWFPTKSGDISLDGRLNFSLTGRMKEWHTTNSLRSHSGQVSLSYYFGAVSRQP